MRPEVVAYAVFVLLLITALATYPSPSFSRVVVKSCVHLVNTSSTHSATLSLPCELKDGKLSYREVSLYVPTSYGVVVKGEHWACD